MLFYPHERVALFIDGANTHGAARALGLSIDFKRLLALFRTKSHLVRAYYYTTILEDTDFSSVRPLVDWLEYNGFTLVTKPAKQFSDADGRLKIKGNLGVEIAVDAMQLANQIDHAVLFTGDGDFVSLVSALQDKGKRVSVVSTLVSKPAMVSDELRRQADQFIDIVDLEPLIRRYDDNRAPRADQERRDAGVRRVAPQSDPPKVPETPPVQAVMSRPLEDPAVTPVVKRIRARK